MLRIGSLALTPSFDPETVHYTAATTNATNTINATAVEQTASVALCLNGESATSPVTWSDGVNVLEVVVTPEAGSKWSKTYTITVTKTTTTEQEG